jgi:hypothetical protein
MHHGGAVDYDCRIAAGVQSLHPHTGVQSQHQHQHQQNHKSNQWEMEYQDFQVRAKLPSPALA